LAHILSYIYLNMGQSQKMNNERPGATKTGRKKAAASIASPAPLPPLGNELAMNGPIYGILVDYHAPRQDGGVPTVWDGWHRDREDAIGVLRFMREKYPGANVSLIAQLDEKSQP
jgi:hypothetical protein